MRMPHQYYTCKHPFILFKTHTISSKANLDLYIGDNIDKNWLNLNCQDFLKNLLNITINVAGRYWLLIESGTKNVKRFSLHHEEKIYNKNYCRLPIHSFFWTKLQRCVEKIPLWLDLMSNPLTTAVSCYKAISKENPQIFHSKHSPFKMVNNK